MPKRKANVAVSPTKPASNTVHPTPSRTRASKKVRFSAGAAATTTTAAAAAAAAAANNSTSTGLTPAIQKTLLSTPRRRACTPGKLGYVPSSSPAASDYDYVQFTPLRQTLDERCKRRIRRNGLSELVNDYQAEKSGITHLRHELRRKDQELKQMQQELEEAKRKPQTEQQVVQTEAVQSRVDEVEQELSHLRRSFGVEPPEIQDDVNWDHIPRRGSSGGRPRSVGGDTIPIFDDEEADPYPAGGTLPPSVAVEDRVDATLMSLELASARQAKQDMLHSFSRNSRSFEAADLLDFADSSSPRPRDGQGQHQRANLASRRVNAQEVRKQLSLAKSRADDAELALSALEGEVRALGFSQVEGAPACACLAALADHFRAIRLDLEHLMPGESSASFDNAALLPELVKKLKQLVQQLAARDAELQGLRTQEKSLRGNFEHAIVAAAKAQNKVKELEKSLDDAAEDSLHIRMKSQQLERDLHERQSDVQKLQAALEKYRQEVHRLEALINQVEDHHQKAMATVQASANKWEAAAGDMEAKAAAEALGRRKAEESAVRRLAKIQELEGALNKAKEQAEETAERLQDFEERWLRHSQEVGQLNVRNSNLSTALTSAEAEIAKLKTINQKLEERYRNEVESGQHVTENLQNELIKAATRIIERGKNYRRSSKARFANWELESEDYAVGEDGLPLTPASTVRFADDYDNDDDDNKKSDDNEDDQHQADSSPTREIPASVEVRRGRKRQPQTPALGVRKRGRRRYDSGVGMMSSSADVSEAEEDVDDSGLALASDDDAAAAAAAAAAAEVDISVEV